MASAEVSLNDGQVVLTLEEDNHVRLDRLRQVVRDQGFTPREAEIRARGVVDRRDTRLLFRTPEGEIVLEVEGEPAVLEALDGRLGETVVVTGRVDQEATGRIRITGITPS